jgi:K+-sensing histidine kinase KdpD
MKSSISETTTSSRGQAVDSPVRLEALRETGLLDSVPDESLDRYTRLAAALLNTEISLITLVDQNRQFFKSHIGLGEPLCSLRETPLSHSFCKHVVQDGEMLVIEDARTDPRVSTNPAVLEYGVVSYLGAPLKTRDGQILGSLCVIGTEPRQWTETDIKRLSDLAEAVMREIELQDRSRTLQETITVVEMEDDERRQRLRRTLENLRSPAATVSSCTEQLAGGADEFKPWQMDLLQRCKDSAAGLQRTIRELIASEVNGESVCPSDVQTTSASLLVRRSIRTLQPLADDACVQIDLLAPDHLIFLDVDQRKIEHVLIILLTNAIQCSQPEGRVSVEIQLVEDLGWPRCRITVRDHCSSIPDREKDQIFHTAMKNPSLCGRGGLVFCRRVIEGHGGQIHVADTPEKGATFYFSLPLANRQVPPAAETTRRVRDRYDSK